MPARTKSVEPEAEAPTLTPDDIARYYELKEVLTAPLLKELADLEARFKNELPVGAYPSKNGYLVKRWEQIGALKEAEFLHDYTPDQNPELFIDQPDMAAILELITPEANPDLFVKTPNVSILKETLNEAEKLAYFKQAQYLKITKTGAAE